MAEGFARALRPGSMEPASAGLVARPKCAMAVRVMIEAGIDISRQEPKTLRTLLGAGRTFDIVYTVCDHACEGCPRFPESTRIVHRRFDDPPRLAAKTPDEVLGHYRRVRDEIRAWIESM